VTGAERGAGAGGRGRRNRIGRHPLTSLGKRRIAHVWHSIRRRRVGDLGVKCRGCLINGDRTYEGAGVRGCDPSPSSRLISRARLARCVLPRETRGSSTRDRRDRREGEGGGEDDLRPFLSSLRRVLLIGQLALPDVGSNKHAF